MVTDLQPEDFEDEDFRENYFGGLYDVQCSVCNGQRVLLGFDEERATPRQKTKFAMIEEQIIEAGRDWESERHIRMMESGGYDY